MPPKKAPIDKELKSAASKALRAGSSTAAKMMCGMRSKQVKPNKGKKLKS